jgi:hypothetical protein
MKSEEAALSNSCLEEEEEEEEDKVEIKNSPECHQVRWKAVMM